MQVSSSPASESSEPARAFLQGRVALFWKVFFFINLLSIGIGFFGVIARPGNDFLLNVASTLQSGLFWWLGARGERSIRFSRFLDGGGLLINVTIGALLGRVFSAQFSAEQQIATGEGAVMADALIAMVLQGGVAMVAGIRAALIPSRPGWTILVTSVMGLPIILVTCFVEPTLSGQIVMRAMDARSVVLLLPILCTMWGFGVLTSVIITHVIYGLRAEVRQAQKLGQYVLGHKIGEGGMGEVYQARHAMMRRPSAIKLLPADKVEETSVRRFEREVQLTARLTHPNTITIFDYGRTESGVFYYAMELLHGATLQRIVELEGPQLPGRVTRILSMACGALTEAHGLGLIHRDIKPANIMLCTQGGELDVVKVLDFGLVKELKLGEDATLTNVNAMMGTPLYMAPECIRDSELVDARSDIYALGAVAYYLLSGRPLFDGKTVVEVCSQHLHQAPPPFEVRGVKVPAALEALVFSCLEKEPTLRPQSTEELKRLLQACEVEPWGPAQAQDWWRVNGGALKDARQEPYAKSRTIAVDKTGLADGPQCA